MSAWTVRHPLVSFHADADGTVRIHDELEDNDLVLRTADSPALEQALTALFHFPVDNAVSVTTSALHVEGLRGAFLRDETGEHLGEFGSTPRELDGGTYYLEIDAEVKTYVRVTDVPLSVVSSEVDQHFELDVTFDRPTRVVVGSRSLHRRPQTTITVPDDPAALQSAVSYLGSAIKEFSPERSWPNLRGHPPAIEPGDELHVPSSLTKPETGVRITVPADYADVYRVAPLAFYFGATVEEGDAPALHLDNGYTEPLSTPSRTLEEAVERVLGRSVLLDSLARIGGYYSFPRYEYDELAPTLPFYPPNLYDASLSDQLIEYLEVPFSDVEPYLPRWPTTAVLRPRHGDAAFLPSLLDSLARVHVADAPLEPPHRVDRTLTGVTTYTAGTPPVGTGRLVRAAFDTALSRATPQPSGARFTFVTDSDDRASRLRALLDEARDDRLDAAAVTVLGRPTRRTLREQFQASVDYLHCDVPVSADGFGCADGTLDPATLTEVGVTAFALAGDGSLDAGVALAESGAVTGLATADRLSPRLTAQLAAYLLFGYPFATSVALADVEATTPHRFVGDANRVVVRKKGYGVPGWWEVRSVDQDDHDAWLYTATTSRNRLGSVSGPASEDGGDAYQLNGAVGAQSRRIATSTVVSLLRSEDPVRLNGELYLDEVDASEAFVRRSALRTLEPRREYQ